MKVGTIFISSKLFAYAAFINPAAFNLGTPGNIKLASLIEMAIGAAVGAITFSGSVIAFLKLQGIMSGAPITFKGQHLLNALLLILIVSFYFSKNFFCITRNFCYEKFTDLSLCRYYLSHRLHKKSGRSPKHN